MSLDLNMRGRSALITGASSGLGQHLAELLASHGVETILIARRIDRLQALAVRLSGDFNVKSTCIQCDVTSEESVAEAAEKIYNTCSPSILINNAGEAGQTASFANIPIESCARTFDVNTMGALRMSQEFIRRRIKTDDDSCIINVASTFGLKMKAGSLPYMVSKAALISLTRALALEIPETGVRVNAVAPGFFRSEMTVQGGIVAPAMHKSICGTPLARMISLDEVAWPILVLASGRSSAINGAVISVDGGQSA